MATTYGKSPYGASKGARTTRVPYPVATPRPRPITGPPAATPPVAAPAAGTPSDGAQSWIGAWTSDAVDSVKNMASGLVEVIKTAGHYALSPSEYAKDVSLLTSGKGYFDESTKLVWNALKEPYQHGLWEAVKRRPFTTLLDATAIASLAGGVAQLSGRALRTAGAAGRALPVSRAGRVLESGGRVVEGLANKIDPLMAAGRGIGRLAAKPLASIWGIGPHSKDMQRLSALAVSRRASLKADDLHKLILNGLTPEESKTLLRALNVGEADDMARLAANPKLQQRYNAWDAVVRGQEDELIRKRRLVLDEEAFHRRAKAHSLWKYGEVTPDNVARSVDDLRNGRANPIYTQAFTVKDDPFDLFELFHRDLSEAGRMNRLEQFTGKAAKYETDANRIMARQVSNYHDTLAKLDLMDLIQQHFAKLGLLKVVRQGEAVPEGFGLLKNVLYKKYFNDQARVDAQIIRELSSGKAPEQAIMDAKAAIDAAGVQAPALKGATELAIPLDAAAWIDNYFRVPGPWAQLYDRTTQYWKALATVFSPRYWWSVLFGNAALSAFYGLNPRNLFRSRKLLDSLPDELLNVINAERLLTERGIFSRTAVTLQQYASRLDDLWRRGIFTQEVIAELRKAGMSYFAAEKDVLAAVAEIGRSPRRWAETVLDIQRVEESFALNNTRLQRLQKAHQRAVASEGKLFEDLRIKEEYAKWMASGKREELLAMAQGEYAASAVATGKRSEYINKPGAYYIPYEKAPTEALGRLKHAKSMAPLGRSGRPAYERAMERLHVKVSRVQALEGAIKDARAAMHQQLLASGELYKRLPELGRQAAVANRAILTANRFFGSYLRLNPVERAELRRLIPFYVFTKAMTSLVFRMPFLMPIRAWQWNRLSEVWMDLLADDEGLPDTLRAYTPVYAHEDGSVTVARFQSWSPFGGLREVGLGGVGVPSLLNVVEQNPLAKLVYEQSGGQNQWLKKPLSPGEYGTRLDNGSVVQYKGGRFQLVTPTPSLWRSLYYLFPHSQYIDAIATPYMQDDRGWPLNPRPVRRPDGTVMYPSHLAFGLLALVGAPRLMTVNMEDQRQRERRARHAVYKSFLQDLRRMPPGSDREAVLQVLRDYSQQYIQPTIRR